MTVLLFTTLELGAMMRQKEHVPQPQSARIAEVVGIQKEILGYGRRVRWVRKICLYYDTIRYDTGIFHVR